MYIEVYIGDQYLHRYYSTLFGLGPINQEYILSLSLQKRTEYRAKAAANFVTVMEQQLKRNGIMDNFHMCIVFESMFNDWDDSFEYYPEEFTYPQ